MTGLRTAGTIRSRPLCIAGRSLSSVNQTARPLSLPGHLGRHSCVRRRLHKQTVAVVAAPEKVDTGNAPPFQAWTTGAAIKKREDIKSIMVLGAGPIIIGQVAQTSSWIRVVYTLPTSDIVSPNCRPASLTTRGRKHAKH